MHMIRSWLYIGKYSDTLNNCHPDAMPHPVLWESLCHYYQEDISLQKMMQVAWSGQ